MLFNLPSSSFNDPSLEELPLKETLAEDVLSGLIDLDRDRLLILSLCNLLVLLCAIGDIDLDLLLA